MARTLLVLVIAGTLAACGKGTPITSGTPTPAPTPPPVVTAQYKIPTAASEPLNITLGSDDNLFLNEFAASKIAKLNTGGKIVENVTPSKKSGPYGIASGPGPDLNVWFTEETIHKVGQISTAGPPYIEYTMPNSASTPTNITLGSDGNMWLTDPGTNSIWQVRAIKHKPFVIFTQFQLTGNAQPLTITNGPDGALWFTEPGTNRIGRLPISGYPLSEYAIPTANSDPIGIAAGTDNALWFVEQKAKQIGRITTAGVISAEYALPHSTTPDQILQGVDGNFYFTDTGGNRIGQFLYTGHHVNYYNIPTKDSQPTGMVLGPDSQIYFVETAGNKIGQFRYFAV